MSAFLIRAHNWAAGKFEFVQYPRPRRQVAQPGALDTTLRLGIFAWLMLVIWGGGALWFGLFVLYALL